MGRVFDDIAVWKLLTFQIPTLDRTDFEKTTGLQYFERIFLQWKICMGGISRTAPSRWEFHNSRSSLTTQSCVFVSCYSCHIWQSYVLHLLGAMQLLQLKIPIICERSHCLSMISFRFTPVYKGCKSLARNSCSNFSIPT